MSEKYNINTTKCPVCEANKLRIGQFGEYGFNDEYHVTCNACDFTSKTFSADYGEVFQTFMHEEYSKVAAEHILKHKEPEMLAYIKQPNGKVKITYNDGSVVFIDTTVFEEHYYEITSISKEEVVRNFSNHKIYNKLVRDKIPDIIAINGASCQTEILDDKAYLAALNNKLTEEVSEYLKDETIEELADIIEVVYAITKAKGVTLYCLESIRENKKNERGGFDNKIFLKETYDDNT